MNPEFIKPGLPQAMSHVTEECGEVLQMIGKIGRFGYSSRYPNLPNSESNAQKLYLELGDLIGAIERLLDELENIDNIRILNDQDSKN